MVLGQAGSDEVALATMALAAGRRLHITHLQFSGYRKANGLPFASGAEALAAVVNSHPKFDCGCRSSDLWPSRHHDR